nr:oligosaccharide flippase family protein [uncultured Roseibium sp.]
MKSFLVVIILTLVSYAFPFVRNIVVARYLTVEQFGIASTFAIVYSLVQMMANIGFNAFVVQAKDGDEPGFMAALHSLLIMRGVAGAALMLICAYPYAYFIGQPELVWSYMLFAAVPLLLSGASLDVHRQERQSRFTSVAMAQILAHTASLVALIPLFYLFDDYQIMVYSIFTYIVVYVVFTHFYSERSYSLSWNEKIFRRILTFGVPLLINNVLLFIVFNGDRLIVANQLGLETLALFSIAFMMSLIVSSAGSKLFSTLMLPILSRAQEKRSQFRELACLSLEIALFLMIGLVLSMLVLGPAFIITLFGEKYFGALSMVLTLAFVQGFRLAKIGPVVVATAQGHTRYPLFADAVRVVFLPLAFLALMQTGNINYAIFFAFLGEFIGFLIALFLMLRQTRVRLTSLLPSLAMTGLILVLAFAETMSFTPQKGVLDNIHLSHLGLILLGLLYVAVAPKMRRTILDFSAKKLRRAS